MYNNRPNLMLGFHGCDLSVRNELLMKPDVVKVSTEAFDWLGHGFYIWENNFERARQWAVDKHKQGKIKDPSVIGVVYQLDYCLDFTDSHFIGLLAGFYENFKQDLHLAGKDLPKNRDVKRDQYQDKILRELDCSVIEYMHSQIEETIKNDILEKGYSEYQTFDTVRGVFTEGGPAFEGAGIQKKNHIQICIRNLNCIKGFFIPRQKA